MWWISSYKFCVITTWLPHIVTEKFHAISLQLYYNVTTKIIGNLLNIKFPYIFIVVVVATHWISLTPFFNLWKIDKIYVIFSSFFLIYKGVFNSNSRFMIIICDSAVTFRDKTLIILRHPKYVWRCMKDNEMCKWNVWVIRFTMPFLRDLTAR